jgi:hypothetical protein
MPPPAFQFYPKDWLASMLGEPWDVGGLHIHLIAYSWENGPLPDDPKWRQRVIGTDAKTAARLWAAVAKRWKKTAAGWINPRLERQREIQASFSAHGKQAASKRWAYAQAMPASTPRADAQAMPASMRRAMPKRCSASSSASSSSDQDQPAAARPVYVPYKVCVAMATKAYAEEPTDDPGAVAERIKTMCAQQGFAYGPDVIGRAMRAADRARTRKRA